VLREMRDKLGMLISRVYQNCHLGARAVHLQSLYFNGCMLCS
jgi:hypothetical protein